jgi:putative endonuclease
MFIVYILQSQTSQRYYIGQTNNLSDRLIRQNSGRNRSTKFGGPWKVIYQEEFKKRAELMKREKEIKSYKSGNAFKKLVA